LGHHRTPNHHPSDRKGAFRSPMYAWVSGIASEAASILTPQNGTTNYDANDDGNQTAPCAPDDDTRVGYKRTRGKSDDNRESRQEEKKRPETNLDQSTLVGADVMSVELVSTQSVDKGKAQSKSDPRELLLHIVRCEGCATCADCPKHKVARSSLSKLQGHTKNCGFIHGCPVCAKFCVFQQWIREATGSDQPGLGGAPDVETHGLPHPPLAKGSKGPGVAQLQQALIKLSFMHPDAIRLRAGFFGPRTHKAIIAAQDFLGIEPTGVYDEAIQTHLEVALIASQRPNDFGTSCYASTEVRSLTGGSGGLEPYQRTMPNIVTGIPGNIVDMIKGGVELVKKPEEIEATPQELQGESQGLPQPPLLLGAQGPGIGRLQDALIDAKVLQADAISQRKGLFGPRTHAAIEDLQSSIGKEPTGIYDEAVQQHLETALAAQQDHSFASSYDRPAKQSARPRAATKVPARPVGLPEAPISKGQRGPGVTQLQEVLVSKGLMRPDAIRFGPGYYGPQTNLAVADLQRNLGIKATGVYDEAVQAHLERLILNGPEDSQPLMENGQCASNSGTGSPNESQANDDSSTGDMKISPRDDDEVTEEITLEPNSGLQDTKISPCDDDEVAEEVEPNSELQTFIYEPNSAFV